MQKETLKVVKNQALIVYQQEWEKGDIWTHQFRHYAYLKQIFNHLRPRLGFIIDNDKSVAKSIRKDYFYGKWQELEFTAEMYPTGFRIQFFQNVNFENKHGGKYDFDKYEKMPYLTKKRFLLTCNEIISFTQKELNIADSGYEYEAVSAEDYIKRDYVKAHWRKETDINFDLNNTPSDDYKSNITDKHGKEIKQGDIKYFVGYNGRYNRGRAYHHINNMWWVILNDTDFANKACFELEDKPAVVKGRFHKNTAKRIKEELQKSINNLDFEKSIVLRDLLKKQGLLEGAK
ncbi:hypothetical protein Dip510_001571 [Elusimicrobium posterum]